jgi:hypothetical protein
MISHTTVSYSAVYFKSFLRSAIGLWVRRIAGVDVNLSEYFNDERPGLVFRLGCVL